MISLIVELSILIMFTTFIYLIVVHSTEASLNKRKIAGLIILYSCFIAFGFSFLLVMINVI